MELSPGLIESLVVVAIVGLCGWVYRLQAAVNALALKLAESHPTKEDVRLAVQEAIKPFEVQMTLLMKMLTDRSIR